MNHTDGKYWIDGGLVSAARAALPLTDLMALRGYGAFEAVRTYNRKPFLLDQHLRRLRTSCRHLCLRLPLPLDDLKAAVLRTLAANRYPDSLVKIFVSGGDASGFVPEGRERLMILVGPLREFPQWFYQRGIALKTTPLVRAIPEAKTVDYTAGIRETILALRKGFQEVAYVDERGSILEGTQFSVVAVVGRTLYSAQTRILPGVTAEYLLRLAGREGFQVKREPLPKKLLEKASEVFITSTNREALPVVRVDRQRIGNGKPGPVVALLRSRFQARAAAAKA